MNRGDLRTEVQNNTGRTDKTTQINTALNLGIKEIAKRHYWGDLKISDTSTLSLTIGESSISLPSGFHQLIEARITDQSSVSYRLGIKPKVWVVDRVPDVDQLTNSKPTWGYVEGGTLNFAPPADAAYKVYITYYKLPSDFDSDSTSNPISTADMPLIAWTSAYIFDQIQEQEEAIVWRGRFEQDLRTSILADDRKPAITPQVESYSESKLQVATPWLDPFVRG